jgi:hypothetical protein
MEWKKILKKHKKLQKKSITINGFKLFHHDPSVNFKNHSQVKMAFAKALLDGDKEAFVEILST